MHSATGQASKIPETCSLRVPYLNVESDQGWLPGCRYPARHPAPSAAAGIAMRTYYFDMKDGIPTRGRTGLEFATTGGAIEHSKELARRLRRDPRITDRSLSIVVIDGSGEAGHRVPGYPA